MAARGYSSNSIPSSEVSSLCAAIKRPVKNAILQNICVASGLSKCGVKAELQNRIVNLIVDCVNKQDSSRFYKLQKVIISEIHPDVFASSSSPCLPAPPAPYMPSSSQSQLSPAGPIPLDAVSHSMYAPDSSASGQYRHYQSPMGNSHSPPTMPTPNAPNIKYTYSPFYEIQSRICDVKRCDPVPRYRNHVIISFRNSQWPAVQRSKTDPSMKIMAFCSLGGSGVQDIAFPEKTELKVNTTQIEAHQLRGLKGKPGTTKPVDITDYLYPSGTNLVNQVEFVFALTNEPYYFALYACKRTTVESLAARLAKGRRFTKDKMIRDMMKQANDPDIVAMSQVLSLKCPLSYMRLELPVRGMNCQHLQCFDGKSYLQLQEQAPQWLCPICNKPATFQNLATDEYVQEILDNTRTSMEQVTIAPGGIWSTNEGGRREAKREAAPLSSSLDDDDSLIMADVSIIGGRDLASTATPASACSGAEPRTGQKRQAVEVIDLTLSDDEEDQSIAQRPAKRPNLMANNYSVGWVAASEHR